MKVDLTPAQAEALRLAASFLLAGEWDENIDAKTKATLERAVEKLKPAKRGQP